MTDMVADNLRRVQERIVMAAVQSGRDPAEITLIAVTKHQPAQAVRAVLAAGAVNMGENYVQEARAKREELGPAEAQRLRWHLIGHLQRNKAAQAVDVFDLIQSVESLSIAQALARQARAAGKTQAVLLQVHLGDEETKSGLPPEALLETAAEIAALDGLEVQGLMGIAPREGNPQPHFATLRRLFERLPPAQRRTLSMGMTGDFEIAITEGATMVRIGTAIFGPRK